MICQGGDGLRRAGQHPAPLAHDDVRLRRQAGKDSLESRDFGFGFRHPGAGKNLTCYRGVRASGHGLQPGGELQAIEFVKSQPVELCSAGRGYQRVVDIPEHK